MGGSRLRSSERGFLQEGRGDGFIPQFLFPVSDGIAGQLVRSRLEPRIDSGASVVGWRNPDQPPVVHGDFTRREETLVQTLEEQFWFR